MTREETLERLLTSSAQEILDSTFSEVDLENLHNIKYELGICIKWGMITKDVFEDLMTRVDSLVFLENECPHTHEGFVKRNPYDALFDREKARINGPDEKSKMARDYVLLHTLKKLLGALKTHVNQKLAKFETIDDVTEGDLMEILQYGPNAFEGPDEEEMDLVDPMDKDGSGEIRAIVSHGDCSHRRTTVKQIPAAKTASRMNELHTFCKDCKTSIGIQITRTRTSGIGSRSSDWKREPLPCQHLKAVWKEGEEGKVALCADCKEEHPRPESVHWSKAGLEPFGDDPDKDEIISFDVMDYVSKVCEHTIANLTEVDGDEKAHCDACGVEVDGSLYTVTGDEEAQSEPKEMTA